MTPAALLASIVPLSVLYAPPLSLTTWAQAVIKPVQPITIQTPAKSAELVTTTAEPVLVPPSPNASHVQAIATSIRTSAC